MTDNKKAEPVRRKAANDSGVKPKPRYSELADQIRLDIVVGRHPVGSLLPSEADLQMRFSVSRHTVRAAMRQLQFDGMISPEHGRGYRVNSATVASRASITFGTLESIERYGWVTHLVSVEFERVTADADIALRMRCRLGEDLLRMQSLRVPRDSALASAVAWNETFFPARFADIAPEVEGWPGSIYSLIEERHREQVTSIHQEATAISLPSAIARRLEVKPGSAGLQVRRSYINNVGHTLIHATNTYAGHAFTLTMDIMS